MKFWKFLLSFIDDILYLLGLGFLTKGAFDIYAPCGWVVLGAGVLCLGLLAGRK